MILSEKYDVTYIVNVTGEPDTKIKVSFEGCERQKLLDQNSIVSRLLETLEESIKAEGENEDEEDED